ncbi:MAG: hypothetical protein M3083_25775 [Actinomycetota bacterium]|nr:hypothetical protein [Actinomycetota bacterium]MDQ6948119.1 hypothetical protein [Actinomycetota bacterium]
MSATAVVTGSAGRVAEVAEAIERRGISVLRMDRAKDLAQAGEAVGARSVDYYVQLPDDVASPNTTKAGALAALFGGGLMSRVCEVDVMLPKLAPQCAVVLVTGETVEDLSTPEYPHAPTCVLEMLANAIVTDLSPSVVRTTVVSHRHSPDRIADIALATGPQRAALMAGYAAQAPEMSYDDWRLACLTTTGPEV